MGNITKINVAGQTYDIQDERVKQIIADIETINGKITSSATLNDISDADSLSVLYSSCIYNIKGQALLIFENSGATIGTMKQTLIQGGKVLYRYNIKQGATSMDSTYWSEWQDNSVKTIEWEENSNMNNFKDSGIYVCENGIRTNTADNLPIANSGSAHNFSFVLQVAASNDVEHPAVGQTLYLTNRYGGETKQYIRTYILEGWTGWREVTGTLTLGNGGMVDEETLNSTTEWGDYNGVLFDVAWMKDKSIVLSNIANALTALSGASTVSSEEVRKSLNHIYDTGNGDGAGAFTSNLFGTLFKMRVYDNSNVLSGIDTYFGEVATQLRQYVGRRVVQEIDVIPFTILPMEMAMYWGYQPRTIIRIGIYQTDGSVKWSNFYEADGSESILQIEMTRFTYR